MSSRLPNAVSLPSPFAAAKCGIATLAVLSGGFSATVLRSAGAHAIYSGVGEVLTSSGLCEADVSA
jgi:ABC-type arginine transport system permease subunit